MSRDAERVWKLFVRRFCGDHNYTGWWTTIKDIADQLEFDGARSFFAARELERAGLVRWANPNENEVQLTYRGAAACNAMLNAN